MVKMVLVMKVIDGKLYAVPRMIIGFGMIQFDSNTWLLESKMNISSLIPQVQAFPLKISSFNG